MTSVVPGTATAATGAVPPSTPATAAGICHMHGATLPASAAQGKKFPMDHRSNLIAALSDRVANLDINDYARSMYGVPFSEATASQKSGA
eukprot:1143941-Pelagomonas_calceolata.AAC.1